MTVIGEGPTRGSGLAVAAGPAARGPAWTDATPDAAVGVPLPAVVPTPTDAASLATTNASPIRRTGSTTVSRYVPGMVKSAGGSAIYLGVGRAGEQRGRGSFDAYDELRTQSGAGDRQRTQLAIDRDAVNRRQRRGRLRHGGGLPPTIAIDVRTTDSILFRIDLLRLPRAGVFRRSHSSRIGAAALYARFVENGSDTYRER